jgi:starch-binding outer membrane protein, SusD/RagB family
MKKYIPWILGLCLLIQTSCSKSFLDEETYSSYAATTISDSLGFEAALTGLYYQFGLYHTYTDRQGWLSVWQIGTDIAYSAQQEGIEVPYYNYSTLISTDAAAKHTWEWAYQLISDANTIIDAIEDPSISGMSQNNINAVDAEAKFFRAYAYNYLATCFGGVPLVTEPVTGVKTDYVRASIDEVNSLIISDLIYASENLPSIDDAKAQGRGNKAMAQQLLAEVYLRAGDPAAAETQCEAVINSPDFQLITQRYGVNKSLSGDFYHDMFVKGNQRRSQGNTEAIWVLEFENPTDVANGCSGYPQHRRVWGAAYYQISGMSICDSLGGRGVARLRLNNWVLYGLYDNGDIRNSMYNIRRHYFYNKSGVSNYGQLVPYSGQDTIYKICPSTTKWHEYDSRNEFGYGMFKDIIMMRLGETYLLLAEAQVKQNKLSEAAASINVLRTRAGAPQVDASDMTMDFILDERVRELVGEENRRLTLMRTGALVERATRLNQDVNCYHPLSGLTETNLLMPIPQTEIDLNKDAVLEQNPGY